MKLHDVTSAYKRESKKRIARGGKRGTTSGRGTKGQKSRAGHRIRPAERDLILRIPKKRGFRNKPTSPRSVVFRLGHLASLLKPYMDHHKDVVLTPSLLVELEILASKKGTVKILSNGTIDFPLTTKDILVSKIARTKIEKAGGQVQ